VRDSWIARGLIFASAVLVLLLASLAASSWRRDTPAEMCVKVLKACNSQDSATALRLIGSGAELNCVDESGYSPLIIASSYKELDSVAASLIAAGAKLDLVNKVGDSALILACYEVRAATALLLVEAGAALDQVSSEGKSALDWSVKNGLAAVSAAIRVRGGRTGAELALAQAGEQAKAARAAIGPAAARAKCEQVIDAIEHSDAPAALQLISEGAGLNCVNKMASSPLLIASVPEDFDGVVAHLIAAGANLDFVDPRGLSALLLACHFKNARTALLLVEAGAELNLINSFGSSALDYADEMGLAAVSAAIRVRGGRTGAKLLLAQASEHTAAGEQAKAARAALGPAAARAKCEQLLEAARQASFRKNKSEAAKPYAAEALRLISEGADPDCVDEGGMTPLIFASRYEELNGVAARLVAAGAKLDLADKDGDSALILACSDVRATTALLLVDAGAALDLVNTNGQSALMFASTDEELSYVAAHLIAAGAKLDLVDDVGNSALIHACNLKRAAAALLLVEAGAALNLVNSDGKSALDFADENGLEAVSAAIRARGGLAGDEIW
jgi:ankyrin repeat protein